MDKEKKIYAWSEPVTYSDCPCGHTECHGEGVIMGTEHECEKCGKIYPVDDHTNN